MKVTAGFMARQAAGQSRLLYRALRAAAKLLGAAGALGIEVPAAVRRRRKGKDNGKVEAPKKAPRKAPRKASLAATREEEE